MKQFSIHFNKLPYYEHLLVAHLFDIIHIGKNDTKFLWRILDGSNKKDQFSNVRSDIEEVDVMQH
jgi:hypothetical protein